MQSSLTLYQVTICSIKQFYTKFIHIHKSQNYTEYLKACIHDIAVQVHGVSSTSTTLVNITKLINICIVSCDMSKCSLTRLIHKRQNIIKRLLLKSENKKQYTAILKPLSITTRMLDDYRKNWKTKLLVCTSPDED